MKSITTVAVATTRIAPVLFLLMKNRMTSAPTSGMYVMMFSIGSIEASLPLLRLHEQIHERDQDDASAHDQRVVLHEAALHAAKHHGAAFGAPGHAVHRAVDDVLVEQIRAVAEGDHGEMAHAVDQTIHDPGVEPPQ